MFKNLPEDVLCKIRGFAMPIHPCSQEIKNRIGTLYQNKIFTETLYGVATYDSEEHFWRDYEGTTLIKSIMLLLQEGEGLGVNRAVFARYYMTWFGPDF